MVETIGEAIVLVVLVVIVFLQTWRAAIIPLVAIPVSLIGTFFFMAAFGFTLNNLSLFGLVLAIGIVVDDAIVVVENVERNIADGLAPREAAIKSMDEVGSALIAIALVLCAVFVPSAFITGISGQFYRQFALTIAGATVISLIVSLTLSPAMCALLLKPHDPHAPRPLVGAADRMASSAPSIGVSAGVAVGVTWLATRTRASAAAIMLVIYARLHRLRPQRIPQDAGRLHPAGRRRLPDRRGAAAARAHRWRAPTRCSSASLDIALEVPGIAHARQHRRLLRRNLHQRAECRRDLPGARPVREARQGSGAVGAGHPGGARRRLSEDPGALRHRGAAAAGAGASAPPAASA